MGEFAEDVHDALRDALAARNPARDWQTEWYVERTPVDVAGVASGGSSLVFVEVEMQRRKNATRSPMQSISD